MIARTKMRSREGDASREPSRSCRRDRRGRASVPCLPSAPAACSVAMCSGDGAPLPTRGWLRNAQGLRLATYHWPAECGADGGSSPARAGGKGVVVCAHGLGTQPQARAHVRAGRGGGIWSAARARGSRTRPQLRSAATFPPGRAGGSVTPATHPLRAGLFSPQRRREGWGVSSRRPPVACSAGGVLLCSRVALPRQGWQAHRRTAAPRSAPCPPLFWQHTAPSLTCRCRCRCRCAR